MAPTDEWFGWLLAAVIGLLFLAAAASLVEFVRSKGNLAKFGWGWFFPTYRVMGSKWIVDSSIAPRVDVGVFEDVTRMYLTDMALPGLLHSARAKEQLQHLVVVVRDGPLQNPRRTKLDGGLYYSGLTHSPWHIEFSAHDVFWTARGQVDPLRVAYLYELLNALLWEQEGYPTAFAEGFLDPTNEAYWKWIEDLNGDGNKDNLDLEALQARRSVYDEAHQKAVGRLRDALVPIWEAPPP